MPAVAAGFAIIWALAWRRQASAVTAIEERDGAGFYVERTSPLQPIKLVRTPGFRTNLFELNGARHRAGAAAGAAADRARVVGDADATEASCSSSRSTARPAGGRAAQRAGDGAAPSRRGGARSPAPGQVPAVRTFVLTDFVAGAGRARGGRRAIAERRPGGDRLLLGHRRAAVARAGRDLA